MKNRCFALVLVVLAAFLPPSVRAGDAAGATDAAAGKAVVAAFASAWNDHDMDRFSQLFTDNADWVNVRGNRWIGRGEIKANHIAIHQRFYGKSVLAFSNVSVRMVAPDVAVVHARETITGSDVPAAAGVGPDSQMSLVIVRRGATWLISSGHNTNIAPPPPKSN